MANDVGLKAVLSLDNAGFMGPLRGAMGGMGGMIGKLAALAGVGLTVKGALDAVKNAIDFGGTLSDLSAQTGIAVGELTVLRQVFDDTGVGADSVGRTINQMQRGLSGLNGDAAADVIKQLGINVDELRDKSPSEQFSAIAAGISQIQDPAQRTAASMAIFGRGAGELNALFADPGAFDKVRASLGSLPATMEKNAALFDDIGDSMGRVKMKGMGLFAGITEGLAPSLKGAMDAIDGFDAAGLGQRIGGAISTGLEVVRSGQAGEVIKLGIGIGFADALNFMTGPLMSFNFWAGVGQVALGGLGVLGAGLIKIFTMPITFAQAGMDVLMDKIFEGLGKIPVVGKQLGLEGFTAGSFADKLKDRQENGTFITNAGAAAMDQSKAFAAAGVANIKAAMQAEKLIDTTQMRSDLSSIVTDASAGAAERSAAAVAAMAPAITTSMAGAIGEITKASKDPKTDKVESDRWARLGLNIGGGVGLDLNRRVANATERSAKILERVARNLETFNPGGTAAVWA